MARERFKKLGSDWFFGELLYERVVPQDHFLRKLDTDTGQEPPESR